MPKVITEWDTEISRHAYIWYLRIGLANTWLLNRVIDANAPLRLARKKWRKDAYRNMQDVRRKEADQETERQDGDLVSNVRGRWLVLPD